VAAGGKNVKVKRLKFNGGTGTETGRKKEKMASKTEYNALKTPFLGQKCPPPLLSAEQC